MVGGCWPPPDYSDLCLCLITRTLSRAGPWARVKGSRSLTARTWLGSKLESTLKTLEAIILATRPRIGPRSFH